MQVGALYINSLPTLLVSLLKRFHLQDSDLCQLKHEWKVKSLLLPFHVPQTPTSALEGAGRTFYGQGYGRLSVANCLCVKTNEELTFKKLTSQTI